MSYGMLKLNTMQKSKRYRLIMMKGIPDASHPSGQVRVSIQRNLQTGYPQRRKIPVEGRIFQHPSFNGSLLSLIL